MDAKTIQKELQARNLYDGDIDGLIGHGTMNGVDIALAQTPGADRWPDSRKLVGFEQLVYQEAGYPGSVDGLTGPQTQANRNRWAADNSAKIQKAQPVVQHAPVAPVQTSGVYERDGANMVPRVVDVYHGDRVDSIPDGLWGMIHKASQGISYTDVAYKQRRQMCKDAGILWGAYHFNSGDNLQAQLDKFMRSADPDDKTLMVLDFEDAKTQMNVHQAVDFMHMLHEKLGRPGAIYSGNRLKETISGLSGDDLAYMTSLRLWICQYGSHVVLPRGFHKEWLWQYTGDGVGMGPHYVRGISVPGGKGIDLNAFAGTREELIASWS